MPKKKTKTIEFLFFLLLGCKTKIRKILILGKHAQNSNMVKLNSKGFFFPNLQIVVAKYLHSLEHLNQQHQNSMSTKSWMKYSSQTV